MGLPIKIDAERRALFLAGAKWALEVVVRAEVNVNAEPVSGKASQRETFLMAMGAARLLAFLREVDLEKTLDLQILESMAIYAANGEPEEDGE